MSKFNNLVIFSYVVFCFYISLSSYLEGYLYIFLIIFNLILLFVLHVDLLFLNFFSKGFFPRKVVPSDYNPESSWEEYFITFGINTTYPFWNGVGKLQLSDTHITVSFVTSKKGLALCHEPLTNISDVQLAKNIFRNDVLIINFIDETSLKYLGLRLRDPDRWLCYFEDAGLTVIDECEGAKNAVDSD